MAALPRNHPFATPASSQCQKQDAHETDSSIADSGYCTTHLDSRVPSLASSSDFSFLSSIQTTTKSLREQFMCPHPSAANARRRHEQRRNHPDRIHPADEHVLPPDPEQLPLQEQIKLYITQHHMMHIRQAISESNTTKVETRGSISRYIIRLTIDPLELLQNCATLGNRLLCDLEAIEPNVHLVCCQLLQQFMNLEDHSLLAEQVRVCLRVKYLPPSFRECHLPLIASTVMFSREDIAQLKSSYSGFVTLSARVTSVSLIEHIIYSQTFLCVNPRCNNKNYLHFTPSSPRHRIIKRAEDGGFMETGTDATLLNIDLTCSHCDLEMPESVLDRVYISTVDLMGVGNTCESLQAASSAESDIDLCSHPIEQQKVTVECLGAHQADGCFVNQMELLLQDDLADSAKLGQHIQLIGRVYRAFPEKNQETYLHGIQMDVNNLIHLPNRRDHETLSETITAIVTSNMSPWNTSQAIVDLLDGIVPLSIYRKLKLALLLSAVSVAPSDSRNQVVEKETTSIRRSIHVLVVMNGRDTIVPALMASMAALKSYIFWDHGEETIRKELYSLRQPKKSSTGEIRGSEMSTAKDGIVLFELDQLDKKAQAQIIPVLTTVDGSDIGIQRDNLSQQLDLICCCWATHTSFHLPSKKSKSTDSIFDEDITGPAHRVPLNEKFDIVVGQHELVAVSDVALSVVTHTLRRHMQDDEGDGGPSRQLSREDLTQYVQIASTIQVRLSTDCEQLLRAYFQVMRKKASGSDINSLSSLSTMSTLLNVASCHAKICLRSVANRYDALVSIMIMEETIAARFGTSCLGFAPLLDGKENVTRLYAQSEPIDVMSVQGQDHTASHVPVFDSSFEMDEDMDDFSTVVTAAAVDTDVPMNLQETRDQVMEAMYAHLTRVISEYADSVDV
ncbi:hypothetical protein K457DRAFT_1870113 [Linnemannia elongata AG-77]|uniref:MCMDC2 N-terminal domain-containing protein n=1 Tax=Linnemannia elongata AG-77 TaxID=1314771 RepID=A0A197KEL7_9FUNG|nr:hypothetical protein K457DRAFT_1870113 [Linnemannia elongata AG-77]